MTRTQFEIQLHNVELDGDRSSYDGLSAFAPEHLEQFPTVYEVGNPLHKLRRLAYVA